MHAAGISELVVLALGSALGEIDVEVLVQHVCVRVTAMVAGDDETAAERLDVLALLVLLRPYTALALTESSAVTLDDLLSCWDPGATGDGMQHTSQYRGNQQASQ